jgi:hypothetical protein
MTHVATTESVTLCITGACGAGDEEAAKRSIESLKFAGDALITDSQTICNVLRKRSGFRNA